MPIKPEDFMYSILSEAKHQYFCALKHSSERHLDPKTAFWVVTMNGWKDIKRDLDVYMVAQLRPNSRKELMGLPVRVTIDDEPDIPMIQLVMEPKVPPIKER